MAGFKACFSAVSLFLLCTACLAQPFSQQSASDANHIFNALHSSLRQFGSSLKHNGMSMFLASVPEGTELYHGNDSPDPVTGMEWLAFEPEHATLFALKFVRPRPPPLPEGQSPLSPSPEAAGDRRSVLQMLMAEEQRQRRPPVEPGWVHTYRTKHPLRLVYLDGMSAAKTVNGTLDFEDFVVLRSNQTHPELGDIERAQKLCHLATEVWKARIDGFMRMEAGFEVILCDFERHLDVVHVNWAGNLSAAFGRENVLNSFFNYWRAVSDRFDSIGGGRAVVYYDRFVTAYGRDLDLFVGKEDNMPRLLDVDDQEMADIRSDVDQLIADSPAIFEESQHWNDWQLVVDLIVTRYSSRLRYMGSAPLRNDKAALHTELHRTLSPFIDYSHRNASAELSACTAHFLPTRSTKPPSHAFAVTAAVSKRICTSLFSALGFSAPDNPFTFPNAHDILDELTAWLDWSTWKACGPCAANELCLVPAWPYGSRADHEHPSCRNASEAWFQQGYWDGQNRSLEEER